MNTITNWIKCSVKKLFCSDNNRFNYKELEEKSQLELILGLLKQSDFKNCQFKDGGYQVITKILEDRIKVLKR